jgi:hypothetical protein
MKTNRYPRITKVLLLFLMGMLFSCKNEQTAQGTSYINKEEQQKKLLMRP